MDEDCSLGTNTCSSFMWKDIGFESQQVLGQENDHLLSSLSSVRKGRTDGPHRWFLGRFQDDCDRPRPRLPYGRTICGLSSSTSSTRCSSCDRFLSFDHKRINCCWKMKRGSSCGLQASIDRPLQRFQDQYHEDLLQHGLLLL